MGKLAKWLRLLGFDTLFFKGENDKQLVDIAQAENRIILTRDSRIVERKCISSGEVKAVLFKTDNALEQFQSVVAKFNLKSEMLPFSLCLECNHALVSVCPKEVRERVPLYIWQTQNEYRECPDCKRVYWKGSHWVAMRLTLAQMNILLEE